MRIDNGSPAPTQVPELDARAKLKRYVQAVRRHWYLVAILAIAGAGLGWVSAPDSEAPDIITRKSTYYEATHTLIRGEAAGDNAAVAISLPQAAFLVGKGEVPNAVAEKLDIDIDDVEGSVAGIPRIEVSSIEVQAVNKDPDRAMALADTSAEVLLEKLQERASQEFEQGQIEIATRLGELDDQVNLLNAQIANDPPNRAQLEAQQQSASNQYASTYEQFTALANQPPPTPGLNSLQGAKANKIDEDKYDEIRDAIRDGLPYVTGEQPPTVVETGSGGQPGPGASATTRAVVGLIVGLAGAIALILGLDRFDNRLWHRDDVEAASGLPVLAEIPPLKRSQQNNHEVVAHAQHRSRAAEAYRVVRSALLYAVETAATDRPEGSGLVVMVTSANPSEGKTTTVANLAAVMAEGGFSVLVINCDFRRPRVKAYLVDDDRERESHTVLESTARRSAVVVTSTRIDRVKLVTGIGENDPDANPLEVVATQRKVIQAARSSYDIVLLDTAPFLTTNDASELLSETDQVLLVVRAGSTRVMSAHRTAEVLERLDASVLGVVLNDSDETPAAQYYYNYYDDSRAKQKTAAGRGSRKTDEPSVDNR